MSLSYELISQFAKLAKADKKTNTESTVYGTVVVDEHGDKYVKIDGSDQLTPLTDVSANVNEDERVSVLIKNHTATVTGNISSPAARTGDVKDLGDQVSEIKEFDIILAEQVQAQEGYIKKLQTDKAEVGELAAATAKITKLETEKASIEQLNATKAEIDDLIADKVDADVVNAEFVTINGKLDAANANIDNLTADYGTFKEVTTSRIDAVDAEIKNIDAKYVTTKELEAEQARIDILETTSLTADSATIKDLQADVGNIDTLIFGSAGGNVIQSNFANAVIAQLGNAQIKSAMIDTVSADKINAGDISTNNVRVVSDDGRLVISDETIQISDGTRVRVQIGKDSSGDYSISIWDADGNLMFSEGGITDNAIKQAIIRNDMVKDDANISARKLNISSLFKEINDNGTETIKSNKIYLDEEKQTLDVAFTSMGDTVKSQGTQLTVVQGQIEGKVWQQDIDDATGELNTQYSSLKQNVDGISTTVAEHTTQINDIDNRVDEAQATANQNAADMANIVNEFNNEVTNLQTQIDGSITTWFYEVVPTDSNEPAVKWTTTELKNNHLGDLYYDTITGYCYRWQVQNNTYSWQRITDTDVTKALADAAAAQDTADQKRRVFYSQPTVPYEAGDLWVQGSGGDILRCQTPKTSAQSYALADWVLASKYTDDTAANAAQVDVDGVKTRMTAAETAIEQNKQDITLRATKSEVTETLKDYYTREQSDAAIKVSADSITQTVSSTYATKESLQEANSRIEQNADSISLRAMKTETVLTPTITDNGSRAVKINNALRDSISGIKLYGKTTQFTTTGKNLLDPAACYANAGTTTLNGDVLTTEFTNGSIHVRNDTVFPAGTYTFSVVPITSDVQFAVYLYKASAFGTFVGSSGALNWAGGGTWTFTTTEEFTFNLSGNYQIPGTYSYKLQLEKGSTVTAYEPYTGGVASPNPDYPQDLESIGESKNLFGGDGLADRLVELAGATKDEEVCTVTFDPSTWNSLGTSWIIYDQFKENTTYTFIFYGRNSVESYSHLNLRVVYKDGAFVDVSGTAGQDAYIVFTTDGRSVECVAGVFYGGSTTLHYDRCGIFEGAVKLEDFEPYRQGSIDAIVRYSNNLLDLNSVSFVNCTNNNGTLTSNLNDSYMAYMVVGYSDIMNILLANKGKPFTFSIKEAIEGRQLAIVIHGTRTSGATYQEVSWAGRYVTIDVAEDFETITAMELRWNRGGLITDTTTTCSDVQFEMGDTPTPYEPYKPPTTLTVSTPDGLPGIPVSSDGNYTDSTGQQWICDEVDLGRGVYVQRVGRQVLNGSETWYLYSSVDDYEGLSFFCQPSNPKLGYNLSLCSAYRNLNGAWDANYIGRYGIYSDHASVANKYFRPPNDTVTTVSQWKAWLAENPLEFIYALAEPIETSLSDEQIAAFHAFANDPGYVVVESEAEMILELGDISTGKSVVALKNTTETQMKVLSDRVEMNFDTTTKQYNDVNGTLEVEIVNRKKHITYAGDTAITIGGNSGILMSLDNNNGIIFSKIVSVTGSNPDGLDSTITTTYQLHNSNTTAPTGTWNIDLPDMSSDDAAEKFLWIRRTTTYTDGTTSTMDSVAFGTWDGDNFHTGSIFIKLNERAQFGNFAYIPRSDGSLSFLKVGG